MSKYLLAFISVFFMVTFYTTIQAQKNREDAVAGSWVVIAGNNKISKKWSVPVVGVIRDYEFFNHYELGFFRTGITYDFKQIVNITFGYGYLDSDAFIENEEGTKQHWLYQEFYLKPIKSSVPLSHRYRWEARWIKKAENTNLQHRIRYRVRWNHSLNKNLYTTIFNELFISLQQPTFNQNRLHVGIGYRLTKSLKVEFGYLKNHFTKAHYDRVRIGLVFKTNLMSK